MAAACATEQYHEDPGDQDHAAIGAVGAVIGHYLYILYIRAIEKLLDCDITTDVLRRSQA